MGNKKWQADYIAPLQPPTLATFRSWGSSAGAGRVRPAGANIGRFSSYRFALKSKKEYGDLKKLAFTISVCGLQGGNAGLRHC